MWHGPVVIFTWLFWRPPMVMGESLWYGSNEKGPLASHGSAIFCEAALCSKLRYPNCELVVSFYTRTTSTSNHTCPNMDICSYLYNRPGCRCKWGWWQSYSMSLCYPMESQGYRINKIHACGWEGYICFVVIVAIIYQIQHEAFPI